MSLVPDYDDEDDDEGEMEDSQTSNPLSQPSLRGKQNNSLPLSMENLKSQASTVSGKLANEEDSPVDLTIARPTSFGGQQQINQLEPQHEIPRNKHFTDAVTDHAEIEQNGATTTFQSRQQSLRDSSVSSLHFDNKFDVLEGKNNGMETVSRQTAMVALKALPKPSSKGLAIMVKLPLLVDDPENEMEDEDDEEEDLFQPPHGIQGNVGSTVLPIRLEQEKQEDNDDEVNFAWSNPQITAAPLSGVALTSEFPKTLSRSDASNSLEPNPKKVRLSEKHVRELLESGADASEALRALGATETSSSEIRSEAARHIVLDQAGNQSEETGFTAKVWRGGDVASVATGRKSYQITSLASKALKAKEKQ